MVLAFDSGIDSSSGQPGRIAQSGDFLTLGSASPLSGWFCTPSWANHQMPQNLNFPGDFWGCIPRENIVTRPQSGPQVILDAFTLIGSQNVVTRLDLAPTYVAHYCIEDRNN